MLFAAMSAARDVDRAMRAAPPVMDIEASGFGAGSYPIEIGFVLANGDAYCTLIAPEPGWTHWDAAAQRVHCIARDTLVRYGKEPAAVVADLDLRLAGTTIYSDSWCHDYTWLALLYSAAGRVPTFKLDSLHSVVGEVEHSLWDAVRADVQQRDGSRRHRASADARVLQQTAHRLMNRP
jgi:hypothetical protein